MGWIRVEIQIDGKKLSYETQSDGLYQLNCLDHVINLLDKICEIFIIKDMIIIRTEDRDFRNGTLQASFIKENRQINNIDAYDWNGKHIWNIGDIVGDIKMAFSGGTLTTNHDIINCGMLNIDNDCSFDLYKCYAGGFQFVVDPIQKKLLTKTNGNK